MDERRRLGVEMVLDGHCAACETRYADAGAYVLVLLWPRASEGSSASSPPGAIASVASGRSGCWRVDPDHQRAGVGAILTELATDWLRDAGMTLATVKTGGDPGHARARRVYEKAGDVPFVWSFAVDSPMHRKASPPGGFGVPVGRGLATQARRRLPRLGVIGSSLKRRCQSC